MPKIELTLYGKPTPKPSPRSFHSNGKIKVYNPVKKKRRILRTAIGYQICGIADFKLLKGPVELELTYFLPISKGTSKKRAFEMEKGVFKHIKKPDTDNMTKMIKDCMTGIVYRDDSQVYSEIILKQYSYEPRTEIKIIW